MHPTGLAAPQPGRSPRGVGRLRRVLHLWAGHKPDEVFALKISGALLLAGMVALGLAFAIML